MVFKVGESGCPTGRPKGTPNKRTELAKLLDPYAESLMAKLVELAHGGDLVALRLCIERIFPVPKVKREPVGVELPTSMNEKNWVKFKNNLLLAVLDGKISPEEAERILKLIEINYGKPMSTATINFSDMGPAEAVRVYQQIMRQG